MNNQGNKKVARGFASRFAAALAETLTKAIGSPAQLEVLDGPDPATRQGKPIHFRLTVEGGLRGDCFVELYEPQVADLGSKILGQPAADFREDHAEALDTAISSAMAGLASSLSGQYGDLTVKASRVTDLSFGGMLVVPLSASFVDQPSMPVSLYFEAKLLDGLSSEPGLKQAAESVQAPIDPVNLKLVMDVELNVSLRFGQRQLPLREVLELASGSVVELDRQVDEPVELLLDGKVIARGEAVIVDGNYGLRITEVPQSIASHFGR
jgi:flagellar motor switch protein FliN/FliY